MLKKLNEFTTMVYIRINNFLSEFKKDERALSGVVVAVLLILVSVLAVGLIWTTLGDWIKDQLVKLLNNTPKNP